MAENACGIYKITSRVHPDRIYVGSATNFHVRWNLHRSKLRTNKHHTPKLQAHHNKYGLDDLSFEIIEQFEFNGARHLEEREDYYIQLLKPWFNSRLKAQNNIGFKMSPEQCEKISRGNKNKPKSPEHRKALSLAWDKRRLVPETETAKQNRKIGVEKRRGNPIWSTGLTKETDERLMAASEKKKGKVVSSETASKISRKLKGKSHSPEHNKKVGDALRGRKQSSEVVEAKRQRTLEWWRKKKEQDKFDNLL
jgi:group I intron endonuclease